MTLKDKNGSEIPNGSWFVFIQKISPDRVWGAEHSIRMMIGKAAGYTNYTEYRNIYLDSNYPEQTYARYINNSIFESYDILLIPDDIRDLGIKAVVSYLRLGGLEVPTEISKLINEEY